MNRVTGAEFLEAIRDAQYKVIKHWMLSKYVGDVAIIQPWTPFLYGISGFSARQVQCKIKSLGAIRSKIRRIAESQKILITHRGYHVSFLLDRQTCDQMAEKARLELIGEGYSETEKRKIK